MLKGIIYSNKHLCGAPCLDHQDANHQQLDNITWWFPARHGRTPSHHPAIERRDFPWNKPSSELGVAPWLWKPPHLVLWDSCLLWQEGVCWPLPNPNHWPTNDPDTNGIQNSSHKRQYQAWSTPTKSWFDILSMTALSWVQTGFLMFSIHFR